MNNIKSKINEALIISGGKDKDDIGLQIISKGKQLYASESSYLFFSDNAVDNSFHYKTQGGFLIDAKKVQINNKLFSINSHNININLSGDYFSDIRGKVKSIYNGGLYEEISGGNYEINLKENSADYIVNMRDGVISYKNFKKYLLTGDEIDFKTMNVKIDASELSLLIKDKMKMRIGDYGMEIGENINLISGSRLDLIGLNGNVKLVSRNGEILRIENERPNGILELKASKINGKQFYSGNICKFDFKNIITELSGNYSLQAEKIDIMGKNIKYFADCFDLEVRDLFVKSTSVRFGDIFSLGEKIRMNADIDVCCDNIILKNKESNFEIENFKIDSKNINIKWGENELLFGDGIKYEKEKTKWDINSDGITLVSGGNLGILLSGEMIKLGGELMWNNFGYQLLFSDLSKKIINIGNKKWVTQLENINAKGKMILDGQFEGYYGELREIKDEDGFRWVFNDNLFMLSSEKILIKKNNLELLLDEKIIIDGEIKINGDTDILGDLHLNGFLTVNGLDVKGKVILGNSNYRLELDDGIKLGKYIEMGKNISIKSENDLIINTGGDCKMEVNIMNLRMDKKIENIGDYFGIIKGEYNLQFGNGSFKVSDKVIIESDEIKIGLIEIDNNKMDVSGEKINFNFQEITFGKFYIGEHLYLGEEKNGIKIDNNGMHLLSKFAIDIVSLNQIEIFGKEGIKIEGANASIKLENGLYIRGSGDVIGKKLCVGWDYCNLEERQRCLYLGGDGGQLFLTNNVSNLDCKILKINGEELDINKDKINIGSNSCRINGTNLWITSSSSGIIMGENMDIIGKKILLKSDEENFLEIGSNLMLKFGQNMMRMDKDNNKIIGKNIMVDGEKILMESSRDVILRSKNGDINMITKTGKIIMDGISKKIQLDSENILEITGKRVNVNGNMRLIGHNMEIEMDDVVWKIEKDIETHIMGKWESYIGGDLNLTMKKMELKSDLYGEIAVNENGIRIETNKDFEVLGDNMLGEFKVYHRGTGKIEMEKGMELGSQGKMMILGEEEMVIGSNGDIRIVGKGELRIQGKRWKGRYDEIDWDMESYKMNGLNINHTFKNINIKQEGNGVIDIGGDGTVKIVNRFEGHKEGKLDILSESNTHEQSILIRSRMGGIELDGQTVSINGKIRMGKVHLINLDNTLRLDGLLELENFRVGRNMFISSRGISLLQREEIEMRNMDLNLDGNMRVREVKLEKIDGGKKLDIMGKIRINNGIELKGDIGLEIDGIQIGKWENGGRTALKINMNDSIWNEGIKVDGLGKGLIVEGDGEVKGRMNVGELRVKNKKRGRTREIEESEIKEILNEMDIEMGEDGQLVGGTDDLLDMIKKMMAVIKWQSSKINKMQFEKK